MRIQILIVIQKKLEFFIFKIVNSDLTISIAHSQMGISNIKCRDVFKYGIFHGIFLGQQLSNVGMEINAHLQVVENSKTFCNKDLKRHGPKSAFSDELDQMMPVFTNKPAAIDVFGIEKRPNLSY